MKQIEEYVVQEAVKANRIEMRVEVILGKKAIIRAFFYNDNNHDPISNRIFIIEGDEYSAWGQDDTYLEDLAYKKLGINIIKVEEKVESVVEESVVEENNNI